MKLKEPLVSVIMPTYNDGELLRDSIHCILGQTYFNIELIIINDGCTDSTDKTLTDFNDQRIVYLKNPKNQGYIYSLNRGLSVAKGAYIARMDADDKCPPDRIKKQVKFLERHKDIGVLGGNMVSFNEDGILSYNTFPKSHKGIKARLLFRNAMAHPSIVVRTEILQKNKISYNQDYFAAEDFKLWQELIQLTKFHNLQEPLLYYRVHKRSVSSSKASKQNVTRDKILAENYIQFLPNAQQEYLTMFLDVLNSRYSSTQHIKQVLFICRYIKRNNSQSKVLHPSALNKELRSLIRDHLIHKRKLYADEWITLLQNISIVSISIKYYIKTFLPSIKTNFTRAK